MQTLSLKAYADHEGLVKLEIPTDLRDREIEIVIVMQPISADTGREVDNMGYPIGYFEATHGSFADEPLSRNQPLHPDIRDEIE